MKRGLRQFDRLPCVYARARDVRRPTPMKRGLRPRPRTVRPRRSQGPETHPDEEGIKTASSMVSILQNSTVRRPTPMKRGLRLPRSTAACDSLPVRRPTPMKRGLRRPVTSTKASSPRGPETHPDEEGIKTAWRGPPLSPGYCPETHPDEEGIKT